MTFSITARRDKPATFLSREACVACRSVKRKCIRESESSPTCVRCTQLEEECVYQQRRRGRKVKNQSEGDSQDESASEGNNKAPEHAKRPRPRSDPSASGFASTSAATLPDDSPSASTPSAPSPIGGGFALNKIAGESSALGPQGGSLAGALSRNLPRDPPAARRQPLLPIYEDPLTLGLVPDAAEVNFLFAFYFDKLNYMISILDPHLHTSSFCRQVSLPLFTTILAVAAKVARPQLYPDLVDSANRQVAQGFLCGVSNIEFVQTLSILTFWKPAEDGRGWSRIGYAIRLAYELRLNRKASRPLPQDEDAARKILNKERTWIQLCIADHNYAMQQTLPRMIDDEECVDVAGWCVEHATLSYPAERVLPPSIELCALLRVYDILMSHGDGALPDNRLLAWLHGERAAWRARWLGPQTSLVPVQISLMKYCDRVFGFQLAEVGVLLAKPSPLGVPALRKSFGECVGAALEVLQVVSDELFFLPYAQDMVFIGAASAAVWLSQNSRGMSGNDPELVEAALHRTRNATAIASQDDHDLPAYMTRLIDHLVVPIQAPPADPTQPSALNDVDGSAPLLWDPATWHTADNWEMFPSPRLSLTHGLGDEFHFPERDDDFWQSLFPLTRPE